MFDKNQSKVIPILPSLKEKAREDELIRVLTHLSAQAIWPDPQTMREAQDILVELERRYLKYLDRGPSLR